MPEAVPLADISPMLAFLSHRVHLLAWCLLAAGLVPPAAAADLSLGSIPTQPQEAEPPNQAEPEAATEDALSPTDLAQHRTRQTWREIADVAQPWTVQLEPSVWFVAPGGRVRFAGTPSGTAMPRVEELNLDNPRVSPYGEFHIRSGEWRFTVNAFATSQSNQGIAIERQRWIGPFLVEPGDRIVSSLDFAAAEVRLAYRLPIPAGLVGEGGREFRGSLEAIGGMRFYTVDFELTTPQGIVAHDDFFPEFLLGLQYTMELWERFNIEVMSSIGGFNDGGDRSSISYDIVSSFSYRPVENVGVHIGYRNLAFALSSGRGSEQFEYRGGFAGLFGGVLIRF